MRGGWDDRVTWAMLCIVIVWFAFGLMVGLSLG